MYIARAIRTILEAHTALTNLVGSRIWHVKAAQHDQYPYLVYTISDNRPINRLSGRACADYVFTEYMIVSQNDDVAMQIATELRNALDRVTPGTYSGVSLGRTQFASLEGPQFDDEDDTYIVTMLFDTIVNN